MGRHGATGGPPLVRFACAAGMPPLASSPPRRFNALASTFARDHYTTANVEEDRRQCCPSLSAGAALPWPLDGLVRKIENEWHKGRGSESLRHAKTDESAPCASGRDQAITCVTIGEKKRQRRLM